MEGSAGGYNPRTPEQVFGDFRGRRAGIVKALTTDVEKFYQQCDPEPALGINFARDGMDERDWLSLVAVHSDAWLLAVAFYFGARFGFDKESRKRLFNMINGLPTIYEVVTGVAKKQPKEKAHSSNGKSNKSGSKPSRSSESHVKTSKMPPPKEEDSEGEDEDEEENGNTLCGACGDNYGNDEFWICCDICEKWFHGKCVKITPARAEHIKQYKCPACSTKRSRDFTEEQLLNIKVYI
ncbi:hypothetical protein C4D60_Mb03t18220 [Musa balbisiana]|uniref:PHD finger protein ALFIN-LIKE n=1 Tax=Musa balbisiana TaxID=52838 RepID=A0A4V6T4C9_MUSBA|nr:hypothetical protein C4D60_Mb03t18220 [Musa balbisiana]